MKNLLTIIFLLLATVAFGQKKDSSKVFGPNGTLYHEVKKVLHGYSQNQLENNRTISVVCSHCAQTYLNPSKFVFWNMPDEMLSISAPDSAGYYLVKFAKSKVKFINDSTFTFKINK